MATGVSDLKGLSERITAAIGEAIRNGEAGDTTVGMPGAWTLVGVYHDGDGEERTLVVAPDDQSYHVTLGLLSIAGIVWRENVKEWLDDCTEDPGGGE